MERLRTTEVNLDAAKLIVIESIEMRTYRNGDRGFLYGALEPLAVVICCPDGTRGVDTQANPICLSELTRAVPQLKEMISSPTDGTES